MYRSASFGAVAPGSVGIGAGGSYADYSYDPKSGLSNDPRLISSLQFLTPAQLQTALDGGEYVTHDLVSLLTDDLTGTGAFWSGASSPPPTATNNIPIWVWVAGAGMLTLLILKR